MSFLHKYKYNIFFFFGLIIPALFIFKAIILPGPAVWADAPYFYKEAFPNLLKASSWDLRSGTLGQESNSLWLYPILFIYGLIGQILSNDFIIRLLFYFPSIILAFISPILLTKYLGYKKWTQFFSSFFYVFNTYFLLIIDGGQVGIALSYGFLPLVILSLYKLINKFTLKNFSLSILIFMISEIADVRIALISALAFVIVFVGSNFSKVINLWRLTPFLFLVTLFSFYWIYPTIKISDLNTSAAGNLNLITLKDSLLFFQPHWPLNEFGHIFSPPWYFILLPLMVTLGAFNKKYFLFIVLIFAFLAKGGSPPLGQWFSLIVNNIPFASAFRDSSKFYAPLMLFGGILLGQSVKKREIPLAPALYLFLLITIHQSITGNLNGVLKTRKISSDFRYISNNLTSDNNFFRTLWFPERHPFTFQTNSLPAIDAKNLINERAFASMNVGTDVFNYTQNKNYLDWFRLLGIKYLIFSGQTRKVNITDNEQIDWQNLMADFSLNHELKKVDWNTSFPIYELGSINPRIFGVEKIIAVIGKDPSLDKEFDSKNILNNGFVFLEDGVVDPSKLENAKPDSLYLFFNEKDKVDLTMTFLQKYFLSSHDSYENQWAKYLGSEYLLWKYQLLIRGLDLKEFDFKKGISFSTIKGEKIKFKINVPEDGEYILSTRILVPPQNGFTWTQKSLNLKKGDFNFEIENFEDLYILNVVALIPKDKFDEAQEKAEVLISKYETLNSENINSKLSDFSAHPIEFNQKAPYSYTIKPLPKTNWIIFTDSFNPRWTLKYGDQKNYSLPFYSMVNGFYWNHNDKEGEIYFEGQDNVNIGSKITVFSLISGIIFMLIIFIKYAKSKTS